MRSPYTAMARRAVACPAGIHLLLPEHTVISPQYPDCDDTREYKDSECDQAGL